MISLTGDSDEIIGNILNRTLGSFKLAPMVAPVVYSIDTVRAGGHQEASSRKRGKQIFYFPFS